MMAAPTFAVRAVAAPVGVGVEPEPALEGEPPAPVLDAVFGAELEADPGVVAFPPPNAAQT